MCAQLDTEVAAWRTRLLGEDALPYVFTGVTCCKARIIGRVVS
jgi:transposase-like protein